MKHSVKITIIMLTIFLLAQFIGLGIIYNYIDHDKSLETGKTEFKELPIGERPPIDETTSFLPIILIILVGTGILYLLMKYQLTIIWKMWFLIAVVLALVIAWGAFFSTKVAVLLALIFGFWKIFRPNVFVHNFTELFIYGGLAAIFVPLFNLWSGIILLILISAYDAYAVWKSKHMVKLAKSQTKAKVFAGLLIPYKLGQMRKPKIIETKKIKNPKVKTIKVRMAVLGGGDIGFALIFAGIILKELGLWQSLIIPFGALFGLGVLMLKGNKDKFYPAMPFISIGCFLALGMVLLFGMLI